jgi:putative ribosome biogenesis GTPase RsgA
MATSSSASAVAAAPEENLWSSILNSVAQLHASQRRRTLVVLGQPGAGKTTLVEGLVKSGKGSRASSLGRSLPLLLPVCL